MDITLTFMQKAQGKGRPRFDSRNRRTYTPANTRAFEKTLSTAVKFRMLLDKLKPTEKPVLISVTAFFKPPKNAKKAFKEQIAKQLIPYDKKPDSDNILKAVLDACNGIAYLDDKQCFISCTKFYSDRDYFTVRITDEFRPEVQAFLPFGSTAP